METWKKPKSAKLGLDCQVSSIFADLQDTVPTWEFCLLNNNFGAFICLVICNCGSFGPYRDTRWPVWACNTFFKSGEYCFLACWTTRVFGSPRIRKLIGVSNENWIAYLYYWCSATVAAERYAAAAKASKDLELRLKIIHNLGLFLGREHWTLIISIWSPSYSFLFSRTT